MLTQCFDSGMIPAKKPLPPLAHRDAIAERLRVTREAMGLRPRDIAAATGIRPNAYVQYESGYRRPNLEDMIRYAEVYGVPLDWIYRGDPSSLPFRIANIVLKSG